MALAPGTRLDAYEIIASLGAGGMGEVYRARDTRLHREVAFKVLPEEFAADPNRCAYFEQEARSVAALNHPNVVALHDIGSEGSIRFMISELVPGDTLEALLRRGPLPVRQLLDIAGQVADGLAAAHAAGITHRDLKPANIMITPEGRVKILDFGLARRRPIAGGESDSTATLAQTEPGVIMGTVPYMSPEQIRAGALDFRSDQFSFGLILHEMAAGKRAFQRPDRVQTMAAILTDDAPQLPAWAPAPLCWIIERCLAKQPFERYDSTRDLFHELRGVRQHLTDLAAVRLEPVAVSHPRRPAIPITIGLAALVLAGAGATLWWRTRASRPSLDSYRMRPFGVEATASSTEPHYWTTWSPDGKAVAYTAVPAGEAHPQALVRYLDAPAPMQITHLAGGAYVVGWTPDAQRLLIFTCDTTPCRLMTIATVGGEPEPFMSFESEVEYFTASPDYKTFAIFMKAKDGHYGVFLSSPPGSPLKEYAPAPFSTRSIFEEPSMHFSPDGKRILLTYVGEKYKYQTWSLPFPPSAAHPPEQVLRDIPTAEGLIDFGWMPDSRRIVCSFQTNSERIPRLWSTDTVSGELHPLTTGPTASFEPSVSPDGRKILFTQWSDNMDVVRVELDSGKVSRLISTPRVEAQPAYATSRPVLAYMTNRSGPMEDLDSQRRQSRSPFAHSQSGPRLDAEPNPIPGRQPGHLPVLECSRQSPVDRLPERRRPGSTHSFKRRHRNLRRVVSRFELVFLCSRRKWCAGLVESEDHGSGFSGRAEKECRALHSGMVSLRRLDRVCRGLRRQRRGVAPHFPGR